VYTVTVTDANGCTTTATVSITQPTAIIVTASASPSTVCSGQNSTLASTVSGGTPGYTYLWNPGSQSGSSVSVSPAVNTVYTLTITDANGCTATQTVAVNVYPALSGAASAPDSVCMGGNSTVNASASGGNGTYTYIWSNGLPPTAGPHSVSPTSTTTYSVTITDGCGQTWNGSVTITVNPSPAANFVCPQYISAGQLVNFTDGSTGAVTWLWNFGDGNTSTQQNPSHSYASAGNYTITLIVTNSFGCMDSARCDVTFSDSLFVPNVFSPNGDGLNDFFEVYSEGLANYHISIYDRWGLLVFESDNPAVHWNGKTKSGNTAPDGTYYFVLDAANFGGKQYNRTGFLTLIR
jgi:gliding motility-associated-like protein